MDLKQRFFALGLTLVLGTVGGLAARSLHLPLGLLLGSIFAVGLAAMLDARVAGWGWGFRSLCATCLCQ